VANKKTSERSEIHVGIRRNEDVVETYAAKLSQADLLSQLRYVTLLPFVYAGIHADVGVSPYCGNAIQTVPELSGQPPSICSMADLFPRSTAADRTLLSANWKRFVGARLQRH
jgi:hypothetical protein